jgi:hypothetical protein
VGGNRSTRGKPTTSVNILKIYLRIYRIISKGSGETNFRCFGRVIEWQRYQKDVSLPMFTGSGIPPYQVLWFHNLTWLHGILCTEVIGFQLKKLTCRKLYGNYFRNMTSHAAMQNRIINGRSSNVEEQERHH